MGRISASVTRVLTAAVLALSVAAITAPVEALRQPLIAGTKCPKLGQIRAIANSSFVCATVKKKKLWVAIGGAASTTTAPSTSTTTTTTTTVEPTTTTSTTTTTTTTTTIPVWTARTYSGSGTKVIDIELPSSQLATMAMTHNGSSNFIIWSNTSDFRRLDLLANKIGAYSGTRVVESRTATKLEIRADGAWSVTIDVAARAPEMTGMYSGSGDRVLRYNLGAATLRLINSGTSNFIIRSYLESGRTGDFLANEIGVVDMTKIIRTGIYLEIRSDGNWSIAKQ